ncbi:MAG: hypothetical protein U0T80_01715 [Flavobacteriaceae bacterium]
MKKICCLFIICGNRCNYFTSCKEKTQEEVGEATEAVADEAAAEMDTAAAEVDSAATKAGEAMENAADKAADATKDTTISF